MNLGLETFFTDAYGPVASGDAYDMPTQRRSARRTITLDDCQLRLAWPGPGLTLGTQPAVENVYFAQCDRSPTLAPGRLAPPDGGGR